MATYRTQAPRTYLPPNREGMREMAKKVEIKKFSADLVEDLCNLAAGGEVIPPSGYRDDVRREVERKLSPPDSNGQWRIEGGFTKDRQVALTDRFNRGMKYQQAVSDFLQTAELDKFPGTSPLEQAMNLLKLLASQKGGEGGGEDGERLPIFVDNDEAEKIAERLNDLMDQVESLSDEEKELLDPDQEAGSGKNQRGDDDLRTMKLAADMAKGKELWLKVSRQLDKLVRMRVARSVKVHPDPAGNEVRVRQMKDLGELSRIQKSAWALRTQQPTYFWYLAATKQLPVRERVQREEKQQLLYILIDCSGSMATGERVAKAGGVLMNRLKAVVAGEAQVYCRFFDSELYEEHRASTAAEAKELIRHFEKKNFSGGSTDISGCAELAQTRIEEIVAHGGVTRPELVIVSDGEDQITLTTESVKGTKLHAFVVECANEALTSLAADTGGVGINNL